MRFKKYVKQWKEIDMIIGPQNYTDESENNMNEIKEINEKKEIKMRKINNFRDEINKDKSLSQIDKKNYIEEEAEFEKSSNTQRKNAYFDNDDINGNSFHSISSDEQSN